MKSLKGKYDYETTVAPEFNSKITFGEAVKTGAMTGIVVGAAATAGKLIGGAVKGLLEKVF